MTPERNWKGTGKELELELVPFSGRGTGGGTSSFIHEGTGTGTSSFLKGTLQCLTESILHIDSFHLMCYNI